VRPAGSRAALHRRKFRASDVTWPGKPEGKYESNREGVTIHTVIAPKIWRHAVDTFGTEERALRWMHQPLAELGERTPEDELIEDHQSEAVEGILTRIDYGVYG
jgi:putative toxin-antitoxin system antitoxin component (TIGR02293 family)